MKITRRIARPFAGLALSLAWAVGHSFLAAEQQDSAQRAQVSQASPSEPAFEVASVKPLPDLSSQWFRVENGNLSARMGLAWLIAWAYGVPVHQVVAPEWVTLRGVEIVAKSAGPVPEDQVRRMLQRLLSDRFQLRAHHETREKAIFALTVGKHGPRLKASESQGPRRREFDGERLRETFTAITMKEFTDFLAQYYNGLLDRTGLSGRYDFALEYRALIDPTEQKPVVVAVIQARREALKQIGLQLDLVRASLDFVVVDDVERTPIEN